MIDQVELTDTKTPSKRPGHQAETMAVTALARVMGGKNSNAGYRDSDFSVTENRYLSMGGHGACEVALQQYWDKALNIFTSQTFIAF